MPLISPCPKCREPVTVPDGLAPAAEVRCPLCEAIYPLAEALADLPPELIPVAAESVDLAAPGEPRSDEAAAGGDAVGAAEEGVELVEDDVAVRPPARIETGRPPVEPHALAGLAIATGDRETGDRSRESDGSRRSVRPRRRNEKGAFRFLVEVFVGGLLGLAVAYYALCWTLGPRNGLPKLPLPLLPHTMHWFDAEDSRGEADNMGQGSDDAARAIARRTTRRLEASLV